MILDKSVEQHETTDDALSETTVFITNKRSCETIRRGLLRFIDCNMFHQESPVSTTEEDNILY